jgi:hypothetical protein
MTLWPAKNMGVCFGGVFDDDRDEESLESVFYQDACVSIIPSLTIEPSQDLTYTSFPFACSALPIIWEKRVDGKLDAFSSPFPSLPSPVLST